MTVWSISRGAFIPTATKSPPADFATFTFMVKFD